MKHDRIEIGKLVKLRQGFAINKNSNHHISEEITPLHLLRIGDMKDQKFSIFVKDSIPTHFIANENDIIYTRTGQVGLVFRNQKGVVHNNCFTVNTLDDSVLSQNYLYYALQEPLFYEEATSRAKGAAQPDLPHGVFCSIKLFLPPIKTQNKIASILSAFDDLIENNQKKIKLLEEAAQRLYKEWFVDLRFPGHENVKIVDGVPEGWSKKELCALGDIVTGKTPSTSKEHYYGNDIPFVTIPDMHGNVFPLKTEKSLSFDGANSQKSKYLPEKTLMVSCIGTVGLVNIAVTKCQTNQQINSIMLFNEKDLYYLYQCMKGLAILLDGIGSNGTTMTNVNKEKFSHIQVLVPGRELMDRYFEFCEPIFNNILMYSKKMFSLQEARDRLLPKLMSGEIEV